MKFRHLMSAAPIIACVCLLCLVANTGMPTQNAAAADSATSKVAGDAALEKAEDGMPPEPPYKPKSKTELRRKLSRIQFDVTQNEATEPHHSNRYWNNKRKGRYDCIVCERPLFDSSTKYKSGTGWPSFWAPIHEKSVGYKVDRTMFFQERTEVHCGRCEAHLGHVFNDGPKQTTGKRYCMNSASLKFIDEKQLAKMKEEEAKTKDE